MNTLDLSELDGLEAFQRAVETPVQMEPLVFSDITAIRLAAETVQQKIQSLAECQRALQTCGNALVPIARLPPEIISLIFRYCVEDARRTGPPMPRPQSRFFKQRMTSFLATDLPFLAISHVCRQWRRIALEDALLWTHLRLPQVDFTRMMISRARDAPLSVNVGGDIVYDKQAAVLALGQANIKHVRFGISSSELVELGAAFTGPFPLLEDVEVGFSMSCRTSFDIPALKHLETPQLRRVKLVNGIIPSLACRTRNLTSLTVVWNQPNVMRVTEVTQVLEQCSATLAYLELECNSLPPRATPAIGTSGNAAVLLPSLRHFRLAASWRFTLLLSAVRAPNLSEVRLECGTEFTQSSHPDCVQLHTIVRTWLDDMGHALDINTLSIADTWSRPKLTCTLKSSQNTRDALDANFSLGHFKPGALPNPSAGRQLHLWQRLRLDCLQSLSIQLVPYEPDIKGPGSLWTYLSSLPELADLAIIAPSGLGFPAGLLKSFNIPADGEAVSLNPPQSFSSLRTIRCHATYFSVFDDADWQQQLAYALLILRHIEDVATGPLDASPVRLHQEWRQRRFAKGDFETVLPPRDIKVNFSNGQVHIQSDFAQAQVA